MRQPVDGKCFLAVRVKVYNETVDNRNDTNDALRTK